MILGKIVPRITFSLVLGLFVLINVKLCEIKPHNCDEIFTFYHSKGGGFEDFIDQTNSGFNRMPPIYFFTMKVLFSEPNFIYNCRLLSLIFAITGILFFYKISRLWLDVEVSLCLSICGLLGSATFWDFSIDARPYSLCFLFLTIFIYKIFVYELRGRNKKIDKFQLFVVCFILPSCHYLYGISALLLGVIHLYISRGKKWDVFKIYLCSGIFFIVLHLIIFLDQQKFGNLLMMIAFPTFEKLISYLVGFISLPFLLVVMLFLTFVYYREKKTSFTFEFSTIGLFQITFSLLLVFIIGALIARMFPLSLWFLPRYYLGTVLVVPLMLIFLFSIMKEKGLNYKKFLFLICAVVSAYFNLDSYKHRKYFYENGHMHAYQSVPPDEIMDNRLPVYTKDIILFSHYIYAGKHVYYINSNSDLLDRMGRFFPSYKNYFVQEIKNTPSILLNIGHDTPELNDGLKFTEMEVNVGLIHTAFYLEDI